MSAALEFITQIAITMKKWPILLMFLGLIVTTVFAQKSQIKSENSDVSHSSNSESSKAHHSTAKSNFSKENTQEEGSSRPSTWTPVTSSNPSTEVQPRNAGNHKNHQGNQSIWNQNSNAATLESSKPESQGNNESNPRQFTNSAGLNSSASSVKTYSWESPQSVRYARPENENEVLPKPLPPDQSESLGANPIDYLEQDSVDAPRASGHFSGVVLSAPSRPHFATPSQPPRPNPVVNTIPPSNNYGGNVPEQLDESFESEDPYSPSNADAGIVVAASGPPPAFDCVYSVAEGLEAAYLNPNWCDEGFRTYFETELNAFQACYASLPSLYMEEWMYAALCTYTDELNFWNAKCKKESTQIIELRRLLAEKAAFVAYIMPEVDAQLRSDWQYVDTAFAAPFGGRNYFDLIENFGPESLLETLEFSLRNEPQIRSWKSYLTLTNLYNGYSTDDIWTLLRQKIADDLNKVKFPTENEDQNRIELTENALWLSMAMLRIEPKAKDLLVLKEEGKELLKQMGGGSEEIQAMLKKFK